MAGNGIGYCRHFRSTFLVSVYGLLPVPAFQYSNTLYLLFVIWRPDFANRPYRGDGHIKTGRHPKIIGS